MTYVLLLAMWFQINVTGSHNTATGNMTCPNATQQEDLFDVKYKAAERILDDLRGCSHIIVQGEKESFARFKARAGELEPKTCVIFRKAGQDIHGQIFNFHGYSPIYMGGTFDGSPEPK